MCCFQSTGPAIQQSTCSKQFSIEQWTIFGHSGTFQLNSDYRALSSVWLKQYFKVSILFQYLDSANVPTYSCAHTVQCTVYTLRSSSAHESERPNYNTYFVYFMYIKWNYKHGRDTFALYIKSIQNRVSLNFWPRIYMICMSETYTRLGPDLCGHIQFIHMRIATNKQFKMAL